MGREKQAGSPDMSAADFHKFFIDKIDGMRASTDAAIQLFNIFRKTLRSTYSSRLIMRK